MEILVIGNEINWQECRLKLGEPHRYHFVKSHLDAENLLMPAAVVLDFGISANPGQIKIYRNYSGIVFLDVSRNTFAALSGESGATFIGFCGLPTFLNREILEVSLFNETDRGKLGEICGVLNTKFATVKNQVGLITPRVIGMIINEAYFAIQENIASRNDIDLAMKLGTNYPFGPFEWSEKIGIKNVYELLNAVYVNTKDERYKVCDLLKQEASQFTPRH